MPTERYLKSLLVALACLAFSAGCSRPVSKGNSRVVIQAPHNDKVGSLSLPAGRTACWGINVTGDGIKSAGGSACSPSTGVVAGYKQSGQEITAEVAKGNARKIDLYVYLLPTGSTAACPAMGPVFPAAFLKDLYLVGSATADFVNDETVVEITAVFPGVANNLAAALSMPATCTAGNGGTGVNPGFGSGSTYVEGTAGDGSKLIGRASGVFGSKVLSHASGMKLIVK